MGQNMMIREPAVAGSFYPRTPEDLRKSVEELLQVKAEALHDVVGMVAPHAGYMFSGQVAGRVYASVRELQPEVVVIVGPSHREYFDGICLYEGEAYKTPLGLVKIDETLRKALLETGRPIFAGIQGHRSDGEGEHCIEVQLPFLQLLYETFTFVPIIMGDQRWAYCEFLATALANCLRHRKALLIASSDLSHYYSYEVAQQLDRQFIELLERKNPRELAQALESSEVEACGGGPVVAVQLAAQHLGAHQVQTLLYMNSGDVWVDKTRVVGYLAAVFTR